MLFENFVILRVLSGSKASSERLPLNYGQAMAMSRVLILVVAIGLIGIERFRFGGVGEF